MGTYYTITFPGTSRQHEADVQHELVRSCLDRVERLMSTYRADSEVSRFNQAAHSDWFPISAETAQCLEMAVEIGQTSGGCFDITAGPLVNLWGFGPPPRLPRLPNASEIAEARRYVGLERLEVRLDPPAVRKTDPGVRIDAAGIAKGFAVDRAAEALDESGVHRYCIDVGGEVRVRGHNPQGSPWQVAIETPVAEQRSIQRIVPLTSGSIATSGDYRIFHEQDGVRYPHVIDPRTGSPVQHDLVSVSVLDPSCARADAWATALLVAGPHEAAQLAGSAGLSSLLIERAPTGFTENGCGAFLGNAK